MYQQEETTFINEIIDKMEDFSINESCFTFIDYFLHRIFGPGRFYHIDP